MEKYWEGEELEGKWRKCGGGDEMWKRWKNIRKFFRETKCMLCKYVMRKKC